MTMAHPHTNGLEARRREILRQAGVVLQGRVIGLWVVTAEGHVALAIASAPNILGEDAAHQLESTLRTWPGGLTAGQRWIGCQLDNRGRWCAAPVRSEAPGPPPDGLERRSRERVALELAGLCIGLADRVAD